MTAQLGWAGRAALNHSKSLEGCFGCTFESRLAGLLRLHFRNDYSAGLGRLGCFGCTLEMSARLRWAGRAGCAESFEITKELLRCTFGIWLAWPCGCTFEMNARLAWAGWAALAEHSK